MKIYKLHIGYYFLILACFSLLLNNSCKPKKQEIPPYVSVTVEVKDENKQLVTTATAYLYSSPEAYAEAVQRSLKGIYNGAGSFLTGYVVNGQLVFPQLPSNQPYWILIHDESQKFKDELGDTTGFKIHRDNTGANFYIDKFQNGTDILANIKLEPVNALIKIIPPIGNPKFDVVDVKNKYQDGSSTLSEYIEVRKGAVPFFVRDKICVWTGDVDAIGGILTRKTLDVCNKAMIVFTYKGSFSTDTIQIYLGQNKSKPVANLFSSKIRDTVYVGESGSYTYFAEMKNGKKCVWENRISPSSGLPNEVSLDPCE